MKNYATAIILSCLLFFTIQTSTVASEFVPQTPVKKSTLGKNTEKAAEDAPTTITGKGKKAVKQKANGKELSKNISLEGKKDLENENQFLQKELDKLKETIQDLENKNKQLLLDEKKPTIAPEWLGFHIETWGIFSLILLIFIIVLGVFTFKIYKKLLKMKPTQLAQNCINKYRDKPEFLKIRNSADLRRFLSDDSEFKEELKSSSKVFLEEVIRLISTEKSKSHKPDPEKSTEKPTSGQTKTIDSQEATPLIETKPSSIVVEKKRFERYFGVEGVKAFNVGLGYERPNSNGHLFCLVWQEGEIKAAVNLTIASPLNTEDVRPFDYIQNRYEKLFNYLDPEGYGNTQVEQLAPGEATFQNGQWVLTKPVKVRFS